MLVLVFVLLFYVVDYHASLTMRYNHASYNDMLERSCEGDVRSGVGRDCSAYSTGADVTGTVTSVTCGNAKVSHREAQSGVVVVTY